MDNPRILIVDDDEATRLRLMDALRPEGYETFSASTGAEALEMMEKNPPDMALLDIMMPDMDGYEICRRIKLNESTRNILVIFAADKRNTGDKIRGLDVGADDYITKPFNMPELLAKLRSLFRSIEYQKRMERLVEFSHAINALELDAIAYAISTRLSGLIPADRYSVFMIEENGARFRSLVHNHSEREIDDLAINIDDSPMMREAFKTGKIIFTPDFDNSGYSKGQYRLKYSDGYAMCVPLKSGRESIGVLNLNGDSRGYFNRVDYSFLELIADLLSASINNYRKVRELNSLAITDGLTKVYNHRHFHERLQLEYERAKRHEQPLSCIIVDIDFFKKVNDTFGHLTGDEILRQIAARLKGFVRKLDILARYGGEEFGILLPQTSSEQALHVAERIRHDIESRPFYTDKGALSLTISIGICDTLAPDVAKMMDVVDRADAALYKAKRAGRNRCVTWGAQV